MKMMRRMIMSALAIMAVMLSACGDDDESPRERFNFEGTNVDLKGDNIYLLSNNETSNGHVYREYFITDGTYDEGSGWDLDSYNNATYVIALQLAVPGEEEYGPGEYPLFDSFSDVPVSGKASWVSFDTGSGFSRVQYYTLDDAEGEQSLKVSGGVDHNETMTIEFNGSLVYDYFVDEENIEEEVTGKFYFKGEVKDERPVLGRQAQTAPALGGNAN